MVHNSFYVVLGNNLCSLRKKFALTQVELALLCQLTRTYLGEIERGARNPSIATLKRIANALKVDLGELTKGF
jgi:transcriptional regulator with XRE-family HTH domain